MLWAYFVVCQFKTKKINWLKKLLISCNLKYNGRNRKVKWCIPEIEIELFKVKTIVGKLNSMNNVAVKWYVKMSADFHVMWYILRALNQEKIIMIKATILINKLYVCVYVCIGNQKPC